MSKKNVLMALLLVAAVFSAVEAKSLRVGIVNKEETMLIMPEFYDLQNSIENSQRDIQEKYSGEMGEITNTIMGLQSKLQSAKSEAEKAEINRKLEKAGATYVVVQQEMKKDEEINNDKFRQLRKVLDEKYEEMAQKITSQKKLDWIQDKGTMWGVKNSADVIDVNDDFKQLIMNSSEGGKK